MIDRCMVESNLTTELSLGGLVSQLPPVHPVTRVHGLTPLLQFTSIDLDRSSQPRTSASLSLGSRTSTFCITPHHRWRLSLSLSFYSRTERESRRVRSADQSRR